MERKCLPTRFDWRLFGASYTYNLNYAVPIIYVMFYMAHILSFNNNIQMGIFKQLFLKKGYFSALDFPQVDVNIYPVLLN